MLTLKMVTQKDKEALEKTFSNEWVQSYEFVHYWESILKGSIDKLIEFLPQMQKGEGLPEGHVPCTFLFAFDENNQIVGRTSIRHDLTPFLLKDGGHIGYAVLPEFRHKGYATEILRQSLLYCKNELKLDRVLVTCDDDNTGSIKTIEKNAGVLENKLDLGKNRPLKRRYWIDL